MTVSKIRLPDNTEHDIRAKYLIQSSSSDATSAEFSVRTVTEDAIASIQKIYGNTVVVSNNLVSNSATAIQSKDSDDNVIGGCDLNIPTLTGKLNGTGNSVVIFPDGLKKVITSCDELTVGKAVKRCGTIDLGSLSWFRSTGTGTNAVFFTTQLSNATELLVAPYTFVDINVTSNSAAADNLTDKTMTYRHGTNDRIYIKDMSYSSAADFKAAMNGIYLCYNIATPEEYILDNALQLQYPVVAGGTEMVLPTTGTAPMKMDVIYGNAADAAATMSQNFISVDSMKEFLAALGTQMGGTWSMGYENGKHTFTFTSN